MASMAAMTRRVLGVLVLVLLGIGAGRLMVPGTDGGRVSSVDPTAGAVTSPAPDPSGPAGAGERPEAGSRATAAAIAVLQDWDRRRAAAYSRRDPTALRRLYVPGSRAGAADVRTLAAYTGRGLTLHGLRMQLLELRGLRERPRELRLQVTERLAVVEVVSGRGRSTTGDLLLPRDAPSRRTVVLRRYGGSWRVSAVSSR